MTPVAVGRGAGGFASAESDGFLFCDLEMFGKHSDRTMRAVAEWLLPGFAAGTPRVSAGFEFKQKWFIARCVSFNHANPSFKILSTKS